MGAISTNSNPWLCKSLVGYNICPNSELQIKKSFGEHRVDIKTVTNVTIHCSFMMTERIMNEFREVANDEAFIRFYLGNSIQRVPFIDPYMREPYIFTEFRVLYNDSRLFVEPLMSYPLKLGSLFNITFIGSAAEFDDEEIRNFTSLVDFAIAFAVLISAFIQLRVYEAKFPGISILVRHSIWKRSPTQCFTAMVSCFGIEMLSLCILWMTGLPALVGICVSAFLGGLFSQSTSTWASLSCMIPVLVAEFSMLLNRYLYASFCGVTIGEAVGVNIMLSICMCTTFTIGRKLATRRERELFEDNSLHATSNPKECRTCNFPVWICCLVLKPLIDSGANILLNDYSLNKQYCLSLLIVYISCLVMISLRKTVKQLDGLTNQWQNGHFLSALFNAVMSTVYLFSRYLVHEKNQTLIVLISYALLSFLLVLSLTCAASYYTAYYLLSRLNPPISTSSLDLN